MQSFLKVYHKIVGKSKVLTVTQGYFVFGISDAIFHLFMDVNLTRTCFFVTPLASVKNYGSEIPKTK